ncbi:purine nucleoside phosphorylase LACC1-like isoform X2 [Rhopilema esculentum]
MENTESVEDILIGSKQMIDDLSVSTVYMVIPDSHMNYCKTVSSFIFNTFTYQVGFEAMNVGLPTESNDKNEESVLKSIREKLKLLPSSDGLPLKTLKTMLIPNDRFYHGYTTRTGGVSTHPTMRSLPLAMSLRKKDTRVYIEENRRRLAESEGFDVQKFESASAVHGIDVWVIGDEQPESYDAIVTDKPGYTIAAPGADCQTLLFCDPVKMVVGAAHSGWKGTIDRIQQNVVRVMKERFGCKPSDILVAIGPSIGVCCYNVDENRAKEFIDGVAESVVQRREGIPYLDLWQATKILLAEVGVKPENIDGGNRNNADVDGLGSQKVTQCTSCNKDKFFSYRRDGVLFGNQVGYIGIKMRS